MQTFLPYRKFESSAHVLDDKRLGKQRVETMQIMSALVKLQVHTDTANVAWGNHPAVQMWRGHEYTLMSYQQVMCTEWTNRGFNDTCLVKTQRMFELFPRPVRMPNDVPWLGLKAFHSAHRANLLRKDPEYYGQWGWKEEPAAEGDGYWWPTKNGFVVK